MFHFWAWCVARHVLFLLVVDVARRGIQVPSNVSTPRASPCNCGQPPCQQKKSFTPVSILCRWWL